MDVSLICTNDIVVSVYMSQFPKLETSKHVNVCVFAIRVVACNIKEANLPVCIIIESRPGSHW